MSNIIAFLEKLACQPTLLDYDGLVERTDADSEQRRALINRDAGALANLLGARTRLHCAVAVPAEEDAPLDEPVKQDDDPSEQDPLIRAN